jgi:hypothetical protein
MKESFSPLNDEQCYTGPSAKCTPLALCARCATTLSTWSSMRKWCAKTTTLGCALAAHATDERHGGPAPPVLGDIEHSAHFRASATHAVL